MLDMGANGWRHLALKMCTCLWGVGAWEEKAPEQDMQRIGEKGSRATLAKI